MDLHAWLGFSMALLVGMVALHETLRLTVWCHREELTQLRWEQWLRRQRVRRARRRALRRAQRALLTAALAFSELGVVSRATSASMDAFGRAYKEAKRGLDGDR